MSKNNRKFYDEAFAEVFNNPKIVKSLLEDFIHEDWVNMIDFSRMETSKSIIKRPLPHLFQGNTEIFTSIRIYPNRHRPF